MARTVMLTFTKKKKGFLPDKKQQKQDRVV